jgi:hypothetical protein
MAVRIATAENRPDLWARGVPDEDVWPEYNLHGDVLNRYWYRLEEDLPGFQFVIYDDATDEVLAEAHTAPCWWNGTEDGLGDGIDATVMELFDRIDQGLPPNTLCALAAEIPPRSRERNLSSIIVEAMRDLAAAHGLGHLIAPVRPSWKERYPLTPIERYVQWRRDDGQLLDPWMRIHERLGGRIGPALPRSLRITGTVAEWEAWTGMVFPDGGEYVFPHGLAPVRIDRDRDLGAYWEPNVWIVHDVPSAGT